MPLTPAHVAAVVPLCRWKQCYWLSPLAVGSMSPDFLYFVFPPPEVRHFGHTARGLVLFCIPAGLAVLFAFHRFVKRPLAILLPLPIRSRLWAYCGAFPLLPLKRLAWICALILFGAATHFVWDGFTHENGWAVSDWAPMQAAVITVAGYTMHTVGVLQYGSSLLGLALLAWWSWQWYCGAPPGKAPADSAFLRRARPIVAAGTMAFGAVVGVVCGLAYAGRLPGPFNPREFCESAFICGADAAGLALLVFTMAINFHLYAKAPPGNP